MPPPPIDREVGAYLAENTIHTGDARDLLRLIEPGSVALSVWSPPYFVGKPYEQDLSFDGWQQLLADVIAAHDRILRPGGFLAININDILCFRDPSLPRIQAEALAQRRSPVTRDDILDVLSRKPGLSRSGIARELGCSEQTVDRRLHGNNIRGGKRMEQTRVKLVGGLVEQWGLTAGLVPYDRRIWVKDPAWKNSRWASLSFRSVDEFEYLYLFWKPGVTRVDRNRLRPEEWIAWGSRAVWHIPSVRRNDDHAAKFPIDLPTRAIRLLTDPGDLVLDCFVGSGTTAEAAVLLDRRFLGMDREPAYADLARNRVRRALDQREGPGIVD